MSSSIIVGAISVITRAKDTRPVSIWIGPMGPLLLAQRPPPKGVRRGRVVRAVFHTRHDGALIVEELLPMPPSP
jgi:hypothetical protein